MLKMTIPILPDMVLAVLAAAVAWLLVRRFDPFALPVLLALSGAATLVTGALVVTTMRVMGVHGGAAAFSQEWPSAPWHVAGLVLLAAGVGWTAWRPPAERWSLSAHSTPLGGPALCSAACAICRDESLAAVCVLETEAVSYTHLRAHET